MSTLHLMQAKIDPVRLARWSAEQKISDPDRAAHCLIYETFGAERAPKPFLMKMEKPTHWQTGQYWPTQYWKRQN